jgi:hypothetical protein
MYSRLLLFIDNLFKDFFLKRILMKEIHLGSSIYKFSLLLLLFCFFKANIAHTQGVSCDLLPQALVQAEKIRGLKAKRKIPCTVMTREQVKAHIEKVIEEELLDEKVKNEEFLFKSVGLIPQDFEYKKGLIDLYLSQLGGFYDPKKEFFAMAGWMPQILQMPIMVHELVHGLQDHHYELDTFLDNNNLTTDQLLARSALVEGDATAVMLDYSRTLTGQPPIREVDSVGGEIMQTVLGTALSREMLMAPEALRKMLIFPYTSGLRFAHKKIKKDGYEGLAKLYNEPPISTRQILHPDLNEGDRIKDALNKLKEELLHSTSDASSILYSDTLGEFVFALVLRASGLEHQEASRLASSWRGDLATIIQENNGDKRVIWAVKLVDDKAKSSIKSKLKDLKAEITFIALDQ